MNDVPPMVLLTFIQSMITNFELVVYVYVASHHGIRCLLDFCSFGCLFTSNPSSNPLLFTFFFFSVEIPPVCCFGSSFRWM